MDVIQVPLFGAAGRNDCHEGRRRLRGGLQRDERAVGNASHSDLAVRRCGRSRSDDCRASACSWSECSPAWRRRISGPTDIDANQRDARLSQKRTRDIVPIAVAVTLAVRQIFEDGPAGRALAVAGRNSRAASRAPSDISIHRFSVTFMSGSSTATKADKADNGSELVAHAGRLPPTAPTRNA